jgi:hypothetical protein
MLYCIIIVCITYCLYYCIVCITVLLDWNSFLFFSMSNLMNQTIKAEINLPLQINTPTNIYATFFSGLKLTRPWRSWQMKINNFTHIYKFIDVCVIIVCITYCLYYCIVCITYCLYYLLFVLLCCLYYCIVCITVLFVLLWHINKVRAVISNNVK